MIDGSCIQDSCSYPSMFYLASLMTRAQTRARGLTEFMCAVGVGRQCRGLGGFVLF